MTSKERHEKRYQRRKAAREAKRRARLNEFDDFEKAANFGAIITAHLAARRGVMWKASVARYDAHLIEYALRQSKELKTGKFKTTGYNEFPVMERGKRRQVHSIKHYSERVVRRSFCMECFVPILSSNLIYDNGASIKGRGTSHAASRTEAMLHRYYNRYGDNSGYIIVVDFKNYFGNILHKPLFDMLDKYILDPRLNAIGKLFIRSTDESRPPETRGRGLHIGPEDSQIFAVAFPNDIDHKIKDQWRVKAFNRYMDDSFLVVRTLEEAHKVMDLLRAEYRAKGIVINEKKTQIVKLSKGFSFLKTRYFLTDTGKLIRKADRKSITRLRRRMKKHKRRVAAGDMTVAQAEQSYMSARSSLLTRDAWRTIHNLDRLFYNLFESTPWKTKKKK